MRVWGEGDFKVRKVELRKAPEPPDPVGLWRTACAGLAIFAVSFTVGAYGLGLQNGRLDAMQRGRDSEYYQAVANRCTAAFDELYGQAGRALVATLGAQEWLERARVYADSMRAAIPYDHVATLDQ